MTFSFYYAYRTILAQSNIVDFSTYEEMCYFFMDKLQIIHNETDCIYFIPFFPTSHFITHVEPRCATSTGQKQKKNNNNRKKKKRVQFLVLDNITNSFNATHF